MKTIELTYQAAFNRALEVAMVQNTPIFVTAHIDWYFDNIKQKEQLKNTFKDYVNFNVESNKPCMFIEVRKNTADELITVKKRKLESFSDVLDRVEVGKKHLKNVDKTLNSTCEQLLKVSIERLYFDAVDVDFVIDVAASICALESKNEIEPHHLAEAIQYSRSMIFECIDSIDKQIAHLKQEREQLLIKII